MRFERVGERGHRRVEVPAHKVGRGSDVRRVPLSEHLAVGASVLAPKLLEQLLIHVPVERLAARELQLAARKPQDARVGARDRVGGHGREPLAHAGERDAHAQMCGQRAAPLVIASLRALVRATQPPRGYGRRYSLRRAASSILRTIVSTTWKLHRS
jgi:hypothetical protein